VLAIFGFATIVMLYIASGFMAPVSKISSKLALFGLVLLAYFGYFIIGDFAALKLYYSEGFANKLSFYKQIRPINAKLNKELLVNKIAYERDSMATEPLWKIARILEVQQRNAQSLKVYKDLAALDKNFYVQRKILMLEAKLNNGELESKQLALAEDLITQQPQDVVVLNLLAVHYYQQQQFDFAIKYWKQLLVNIPLSLEFETQRQHIVDMLTRAKAQSSLKNNRSQAPIANYTLKK